MVRKNALLAAVLLLFLLPVFSFAFQIPEVPPPTRDEEGTRQALESDVNYQRMKRRMEEEREKKEALSQNNKGNQAYKTGNWKQAVDYYKKALRNSPGDRVIKQNLLNAQKALARAQAKMKEASNLNVKGNRAYKKRNWNQAVNYYRNALRNSPNDNVIRQNLLNAQKALAKDQKKNAYSLNKQGNKAYHAKDWKRAVNYYKNALKNSPNDRVIRQNLINAQNALKNEHTRKQNAYNLNKQGNQAYYAKNWKQAIDRYQNALKNSPNDRVIKQNLLNARNALAAQERKEKLAAEQARKERLTAERRVKIEEQKSKMRRLESQFEALSARVKQPVSEDHDLNKAIGKQNDLFVKLMNTKTISPEEKKKYRLNLPVTAKRNISDLYKNTEALISAHKDFFQKNLSDVDIAVNPNADSKKGLINISFKKTVEVSGMDTAQKIAKKIDFIIGKIRLPRASFAVDGGRIYSNVAYNAMNRFMEDSMKAAGGHHDSKKFWKDFHDSLNTGQKTVLNWIKFGK